MVTTRAGQPPLFTGTPFVALEHTTHGSISVDQGDVHIDAHDPDHLIRIKHTKGDGRDILAAIDKATDTKTAHIDSTGKVYGSEIDANLLYARGVGIPYGVITNNIQCTDVFIETSPGSGGWASTAQALTQLGADIDATELDIDANQDTLIDHAADLASATASDTVDELVRRATVGYTEVANFRVNSRLTDPLGEGAGQTNFPGLRADRASFTTSCDLIANAQLSFMPYDHITGEAITDRSIVIGRAQPLVGQTFLTTDGDRDGILLENEGDNEIVELYSAKSLPSLRITAKKLYPATIPVI